MIEHQILETNIQGNVSQLEGRMNNQILAVLSHSYGFHATLTQITAVKVTRYSRAHFDLEKLLINSAYSIGIISLPSRISFK